jgi:hypothetical protein
MSGYDATIRMKHDYRHTHYELGTVTFHEGDEMQARLKTLAGMDFAIVIDPDGHERAIPIDAVEVLS